MRQHTGMGLVPEVLNKNKMETLKGDYAIGHVRYSTTGSSILKNAQPFMIKHNRLSVSIAHNGNLVNAGKLKRELEKQGSIFHSTMDSEIVLHLLVRSKQEALEDKLIEALDKCDGAFTMLFLSDKKIIGVRDPQGFHPLCLGKKGNSFVLSSETCSLDLIEAEFIREVEPGEMVVITENGVESRRLKKKCEPAPCIFEFIYFARPDSFIFGDSVYQVRERLGVQLAKDNFVEADLVMSIPDSGNYAALGYARESGIPFEFGMIRNHYIGRTFIQPSQEMRQHGVRIKLNPIKEAIRGKKVIVVEDSIVRGITTSSRIKAIREAGAKEIHMRISCPPIKHPCFYGIDFPSKKELIANQIKDVDAIGDFIGVDSLKYLSVEGMMKAVSKGCNSFCTACFTGVYPTKVCKNSRKSDFDS